MRLFEGTQWDVPPKCERCDALMENCKCEPLPGPQEPTIPPEKQRLKIRVEKRKKGKVVTVISGLRFSSSDEQKNLLTEMKNFCGAGGKIADDLVEIQGDHADRLKQFLSQKRYKV